MVYDKLQLLQKLASDTVRAFSIGMKFNRSVTVQGEPP